MKLLEALKIIDKGWVEKPKGFRVHFQRQINGEWVTDYVPGEKDKPLDSDVAAWRLAWKLTQATKTEGTGTGDETLVNIYVVNDLGEPIKYYALNQFKVFNPVDITKNALSAVRG